MIVFPTQKGDLNVFHSQVKLPTSANLTNGEQIAAVHLRMTNITPFPCRGNGFFLVALTTRHWPWHWATARGGGGQFPPVPLCKPKLYQGNVKSKVCFDCFVMWLDWRWAWTQLRNISIMDWKRWEWFIARIECWHWSLNTQKHKKTSVGWFKATRYGITALIVFLVVIASITCRHFIMRVYGFWK